MRKNPAAVALGRLGGKAKAKPTPCERCGKILPTAREAWMHCRKPRKAAAKKAKKR